MKKIFIYAVLMVSLFLGLSCTKQAETEKSVKPVLKGIPVRLITIEPQVFNQYIPLTGTVRAQNQIKIVAEESGTLIKIEKRKGAYAKKGAVIAVLKNELLQAAYLDVQAAANQAELTFTSNKALFAKKAISENQFKAGKLSLDRARASLAMAGSRVNKLTIKAPIGGYINDRYPDLGAYITPGTPLFELVDNSRFTVRADVAERFISFVKKSASVQVSFDAMPSLQLNGNVEFVSNSINASNRTFGIEVALQGNVSALRPYMIANLLVQKETKKDGIVVPLDAIVESETGRYVFLNNAGKAKKQAVYIREISGEKVLVDSLHVGQQLVVMGQRQISDGDPIQVVK